MAAFIQSILSANAAVAADGEQRFDLPVNPLSAILIHLSPLNNTATIANYRLLAGLLSAIDTLRVDYRGASVLNLSGADLLAFLLLASPYDVAQSNAVETDNDRRSLVIPVPLGRRIWDPKECFPAVRRGELTMTITWDIADTGFDGLRVSIQTLELPDAKPAHFQRLTTLTQTFAATGDNDVDMPIGNIIRGILCFGTTGFAGATPAPTLGAMRLLVDNVEFGYASGDFEVYRGLQPMNGRRHSAMLDHFHGVNAAGAAQEDTQQQQFGIDAPENYCYLDYDPTTDDLYALETKGKSRIHLRVNAEAANAARFIPVEKVLVTDFIKAR